jgi:hypothetical protein
MTITLRAAAPEDTSEGGRVLYQAFKSLADQHNFPPDFPSPEVGSDLGRSHLTEYRYRPATDAGRA